MYVHIYIYTYIYIYLYVYIYRRVTKKIEMYQNKCLNRKGLKATSVIEKEEFD